jgi:hypothetical protein
MSDCLHCEIHDILEIHLQSEQANLAEIAARVTEVLADLILMAPTAERHTLMADVLANLGGMVLEKSQESDPTNPRRSSHWCLQILKTAALEIDLTCFLI